MSKAKKEEVKTEPPKQEQKAQQPSKADIALNDPAVSKAVEQLEETMMELIYSEPFYANLLLNMRREFTLRLQTAGVNVTDQVNLYVNPFFFSSLTLPQRIDLLKHECHHVINNHFVRFRDLEPQIFDPTKEKSIIDRIQDHFKQSDTNKAADLAINEYLPNLPKKINMFDHQGNKILEPTEIADPQTGQKIKNPSPTAGQPIEGKLLFVSEFKKKYPGMNHKQTMEYYYEFIKQEQEKNKDKNGGGDGFIVLDDHSIWHEPGQTEDEITEKVKEVVNKAVEQTPDKSMGSLPGDIQAAIEALNHVPKDWRQDVQRFVARTAEFLVENTRKKRNRRYGILYAGQKIYPKLKLALALDTSGSVCDESLAQFYAEMLRIHNMEISLIVIECDTKVNSMAEFDPKKPFKVTGRGGTAFKPVFDHIEKNKLEIDGLIYFTDGECWGEDLKKPRYPVLWALTPPFNLHHSVNWGARTKIEVKKKVRR